MVRTRRLGIDGRKILVMPTYFVGPFNHPRRNESADLFMTALYQLSVRIQLLIDSENILEVKYVIGNQVSMGCQFIICHSYTVFVLMLVFVDTEQ